MRGKKNTENEIKAVRNEGKINEYGETNEGTQDREQNTRIKIRNEGTKGLI